MSHEVTVSRQSNGDNGFISRIFSGLGEGIGSSLELLPIWAAQQLGLQQEDQLEDPTFQLPAGFESPANLTSDAGDFLVRIPGTDTGITTMQLVLVGGGLLVGFLLLGRRRRAA